MNLKLIQDPENERLKLWVLEVQKPLRCDQCAENIKLNDRCWFYPKRDVVSCSKCGQCLLRYPYDYDLEASQADVFFVQVVGVEKDSIEDLKEDLKL